MRLHFLPPAARFFEPALFYDAALLTVYLGQDFLLRSQLLKSTVRSSKRASRIYSL